MNLLSSHLSPHYDGRKLPISLLVLHYTGMQTGAEALQRLCDPAAKVSAHYLVEEDGRVFSLVDESHRAWHAGVSYWRGIRDVNSASIGIEIVNKGHEWGYHAFPCPQIEAVISLCHAIRSRHMIAPCNVIGHSDVAPERKQDPGELFPWQQLAEHGIGVWAEPSLPLPSFDFYAALLEYGYDPAASRRAVIQAFQRHFRPACLSGEADAECEAILAGLLRMR
jgi:N-acetylmuramoyl-L-alanine amidase